MFIESASVHRSRARIDSLRWPVLLALVLTFACTPAQRERDAAPRVLVIGLDGADWSTVERLAREGRLPTLSRLMGEGAGGVLESIPPFISPVIWTTVATGRKREDHGITNFYFKAAGSYQRRRNRSSLRRTAAIWNILTSAGLSTGIVQWHATYPAEPIKGFVRTFRYEEHVKESDQRAFHPPELRETVRQIKKSFALPDHPFVRRLRALPIDTPAPEPSLAETLAQKRKEHLRTLLRSDSRVAFVAAELIRRQPSNLTLVYLNGIDWISHWFWGFRDDAAQPIAFDPGGEQTRLFANLVDAYYVYTDHLVSTLVEAAGSPTDVVVLSDHGFRDLRVPEDAHLEINVLLADLGYLRFARGGEVDYAGTRAFNFSDVKLDERSIYLNLVGREAEGIVPLEEKDEITTRLVGALRGLQVLSGEPLFASVRINDTREVALPQIPDIEVRINPRVGASDLLKLQGREVPIQLYLKASPLVIGEHRKQGILVVAGPSFQPGAVHGATVLDVTPTLLALFGLAKAEDMPGRVLSELLVEPPQLPLVSSYEGVVERGHDPELESVSEQAEERLRSLGYLE